MKHKLITSKISSLNHVLITGDKSPISESLRTQLLRYSQLQVDHWPAGKQSLQSPINVEVIIHVVGFGPASLSQTLSATVLLHELLHLATSQRAKFMLVIYNPQTPLSKTAVSLLNQYSKIKPLLTHIVEVGQDEVETEAEAIVKKIFPHHKHALSPKQVTIAPTSPHQNNQKNRFRTLKKISLLAVLVFILTQCLGLGLLKFSAKQLALNDYSSFGKLLELSQRLLLLNQTSISYIPGFPEISYLYQPQILNRAKTIYQVSDQLNEALNFLISFTPATDPIDTARLLSLVDELTESLTVVKNQNTTTTLLKKTRLLIPYINSVLGHSSPQNVMFIISDADSPTPTGGEKTSIVLVTLEKGQVSAVKHLAMSKVYQDAPGKFDLTTFEANPEFKTVAANLSQLVLKTYQTQANLVVGLSTLEIDQLLEIAKNQTPNPNQTSSGNSQSKIDEFISLLPQTTSTIRRQLLQKTYELLESGQLFATHTTDLPELEYLGWSGGLSLPPCKSRLSCLNVFLDSRLGPSVQGGIADINQVFRKSDIEVTSGLLKTNTILNLSLKSQTKTLLQLFFPKTSQLTTVLVDGLPPSLPATPSSFNNQINQVVLNLENNEPASRHLEVVVEQAQKFSLPPGKFHLQVNLPTQPGIKYVDLTNVIYPKNWTTSIYQKPSVALPGQLRYNTQSRNPVSLNIDFIPK